MEYDLLVRGGRVVDGSGLPSYNADVAIKDGGSSSWDALRAALRKP